MKLSKLEPSHGIPSVLVFATHWFATATITDKMLRTCSSTGRIRARVFVP